MGQGLFSIAVVPPIYSGTTPCKPIGHQHGLGEGQTLNIQADIQPFVSCHIRFREKLHLVQFLASLA